MPRYAGLRPTPGLGARASGPRLAWVRGPPARLCRVRRRPYRLAHQHTITHYVPIPLLLLAVGKANPPPPAGRRASIFKIRYYCGRVANPPLPYADDMINERRESWAYCCWNGKLSTTTHTLEMVGPCLFCSCSSLRSAPLPGRVRTLKTPSPTGLPLTQLVMLCYYQ